MFRDDVAAYLWSYYEGLIDRLTGRIPTLAAYQRRRAVAVAAYTWLDVVEVATGIDLPETVRHLSGFRDLRAAAAQCVDLYNDLWSLERDQAAGGLDNAVLLAQNYGHPTLQQAVDHVHAMLTDCIRRMLDAERDLTAQLDAAATTDPARADALTCAEGYRTFVRVSLAVAHRK